MEDFEQEGEVFRVLHEEQKLVESFQEWHFEVRRGDEVVVGCKTKISYHIPSEALESIGQIEDFVGSFIVPI